MNHWLGITTKVSVSRDYRVCWLFTLMLVIGLLLPPADTSQLLRIQPALLAWVEAQPVAMVNVIVQKIVQDQTAEQLVAEVGGMITKNLYFINAFTAALPAHQVKRLASLPSVHWVSLDGPILATGCKTDCSTVDSGIGVSAIDMSKLRNIYNYSIRADQLWRESPQLWGEGIAVAIVDSGVQANHSDFGNRVVAEVSTGPWPFTYDGYGHGTMVAGLVAGDGTVNSGSYIGIAPRANLVDVKVTTIGGASTESDVVEGLQWIYENYKRYNIRVVNLSLNAATAQSYHTSPLNAAAEILWFNGIVVVASAGNRGAGSIYPPANDPFIITVGATDDRGTPAITDDQVALFSAYGTTMDGIQKPDLVAPGRGLVGPLNSAEGVLAQQHPKNIVSKSYFRMSGTSVAAPVVSGAIALLLQDEPYLTPDQVKYRLMATANKAWPGYDPAKAGAGYLDIYAAVQGTTTASANIGTLFSDLLITGSNGGLSTSVNWSSVNWSSVNWSSVNWSSDYWEDVNQGRSVSIATDPVIADESDDTLARSQTHLLFLPVVTR